VAEGVIVCMFEGAGGVRSASVWEAGGETREAAGGGWKEGEADRRGG